jgi:hypothetical protein
VSVLEPRGENFAIIHENCNFAIRHEVSRAGRTQEEIEMCTRNVTPDVSLADWRQFPRWVVPDPAEKILDREEIKFPPWFLPLARGALIPCSRLLRQAGFVPGSPQPRGWLKNDHVYVRSIGVPAFDSLVVRECGEWWTVERWAEGRRWQHSDEVLVHHFGSTPVLAPTREAAMRLAQHCHDVPSLGWVQACPSSIEGAITLAERRRVAEASVGH